MSLVAFFRRRLRRAVFVGTVLACAGSETLAYARLESIDDSWSRARPAAVLQPQDEELLDELQRASLRFFLEQSDPKTGLVRDRARADGVASPGKASIAASGFALSAWAVGVRRGWVDRGTALERAHTLLRFLSTAPVRKHGFFYHFMEMDTGARAWKCELSPIDTAIFFAGAIMAREYFEDPEITQLVNKLYSEVEWDWFLNGGNTMAMGWHDETGFSRYRWSRYSEMMILSLLGLGSNTHPMPATHWNEWSREPVGTYAGYHFIQGAPLFIHQFTHAYVDFRGMRDGYADYFQNSVLATLAQRQFCIDLRGEFPTWSERLWGLTASDSANGYKAWGGPPRTMDFNRLDGTVVPCAPAGSVPFAPYETMITLRHLRTAFGNRIWKRYGFVDAFNPETGWVNGEVIGIDLGITLLQAENARTGFVWAAFMHAPEVKQAMRRAGFVSNEHSLPWSHRDALRELASQAWKLEAATPLTSDTAGMQLSALLAARAVGLIDGEEAVTQATALLNNNFRPNGERELAQYAASLAILRQAIPSMAPAASKQLESLDWRGINLESFQLGSASRLAVFFQVASGARPATAWTQLARRPEKRGSVYVLSPGKVTDALLPGLWLQERAVITGASASQLAYSIVMEERDKTRELFPYDVATTALLIEHFPAEVVDSLRKYPLPPAWLENSTVTEKAALLLAVSNLLAPDCMREWFQQDPLVMAGRAAIAEFAAEPFGGNNSLLWRYELAGPRKTPPERKTVAVSSTLPRDQWIWTTVKGAEFKDSFADMRPGDPEVEIKFAFTWDEQALHFYADVIDTPAGHKPPSGRRGVEVLINPHNDGLVWGGPDDFQFSYKPDSPAEEWFHSKPAEGRVTVRPDGYSVEGDIKWSTLRIDPQKEMEIALSPAVIADGQREEEPNLKLNWRFFQRPDDRIALGTLRLE